ncbi:hypothetical protein LIER_41591 [Lithospermum erythrorhizon]|uniref:Integrase catalytic domain-containing protein n=1 Tax=Lithospermum erythrorhizon TaxID=34254 RepID=A0AAV3RCV0_LITER
MIKGIKMMNSSTVVLDEILLQGKRSGDNTGVGYAGGNWKKHATSPTRTFVAAGARSNQDLKNKFNWKCYHCGKIGDIAPYCYKIYGRVRNDYVIFGGGEKGRIIGKWSLNVEGLPRLEDVLLVEGLTTNLISIKSSIQPMRCRIVAQEALTHHLSEHSTTDSQRCCTWFTTSRGKRESLWWRVLLGKKYVYVCVDDFSRYTWVEFIKEKSDAFEVFKQLATQIQREKEVSIVAIRSDHGREFESSRFQEFCSALWERALWHQT